MKQIQAAYFEFENPWQEYRAKTGDQRDASKCGEPDIRKNAKRFLELWERFQARNPAEPGMAWGISLPSGRPQLFKTAPKRLITPIPM